MYKGADCVDEELHGMLPTDDSQEQTSSSLPFGYVCL